MSNDASRNGFRALWWYALALLVLVLDQYTKALATAGLSYGRPVEIFFWFDLTLHHNTGAAFSFLSGAGGWQRWFFSVVAVVISCGLVIWLYRLPRNQLMLALALGLILGGAIGNLWDRLTVGYVVDFISVHYAGRYFPTFNIADSAITVGAGFMLLDSFVGKSPEPEAEQPASGRDL